MTVRIREADGIHIAVDGGPTVVADARSATGDVTVVSHAHGDHARSRSGDRVRCSAATAALLRARNGVRVDRGGADDGVRLLPSGHVVGSRAALIEGDRTVLYTGDVSTRDRAYLDGFAPVPADVLVVESTYGRPAYRFPPQAELETAIVDWIRDAHDRPLVLFGYSLGRAQKLQHLARRATDRRVVVHPAVRAVNDAIEAATDLRFPAPSWDDVDALEPDDVVIAPSGAARGARLQRFVRGHDPLTGGFSGWAIDDAYRYRTGVDAAFPLTDHCDFDELVALVEAVDPDRVYLHHGFAADFAAHLATLGFDAVALRRGQRRLSEFA